MTSNMALLQKKAKEANLDIQFVSFSVDPERDTPKELKHYAKQYGADTANWNFLTGYDFMTMKEISIKTFQSMMAMLEKDKDGDYQVTHSTRFYLVNPEGKVIKNYKGIQVDEMDKILEDLKKVQ